MNTQRCTILIVDDEPSVRFMLSEILSDAGHKILTASDASQALAQADLADLILTDLVMPGMDGIALIEALRARAVLAPTILLTARGSERDAVRALRAGAWDYIPKPFEIDELLASVARAAEVAALRADTQLHSLEQLLGRPIIARSAPIRDTFRALLRLAKLPVPVLIRGETGTGKEAMGELLHLASPRRDAPLVRFNCAAISDELAAAELFGHTRGAFTGAHSARPGYLKQAHGGTLILDEIGELSLATQAKLLRVLQSGEIQPVGADAVSHIDVRIVAITHRDLLQMVRAQTFREDLYYRLCVVEIIAPPLRERAEDIAPLAMAFARRDAQRFGLDTPTLSPALLDALAARPWPGNVRELEHTITRALALHGPLLDVGCLSPQAHAPARTAASLSALLDQRERELLADALQQAGGNQSEAARMLSISRSTFIEKLKRLGLR